MWNNFEWVKLQSFLYRSLHIKTEVVVVDVVAKVQTQSHARISQILLDFPIAALVTRMFSLMKSLGTIALESAKLENLEDVADMTACGMFWDF